jgi:hypothetical protein
MEEANVMPFTCTLAEMETPVVKEWAKVAVSDAPLGTVIGDQLLAVFQSPVVAPLEGAHVALPPKALTAASTSANIMVLLRIGFI